MHQTSSWWSRLVLLFACVMLLLVPVRSGAAAAADRAVTSGTNEVAAAQGSTTRLLAKQYGVNLSGAEFGDATPPGTLWSNYLYPGDVGVNGYFAAKGLRLIRVPFRWERLQQVANGPLSQPDLDGLRAMLDAGQLSGQKVILDMHNYGRYYGAPLTRATISQFAGAWDRLSAALAGHPALYGYELMNEPHDLPEGAAGWASLAQAATDAIRRHDRSGWVLVPGYDWQSAQHWPTSNAQLAICDRAGRLLYAAHQYFDGDASGTYSHTYDADGAYPSIGADRLQPFVDWLASHRAQGILTEYGVPDSDPRWLVVLDAFLSRIDASPSLVGGTYWSAGPWWGAYPLSVQPTATGGDRPQMPILAQHALQ